MIRVKLKIFTFAAMTLFENLVNYDKSKTIKTRAEYEKRFENLVNYDKSKTVFLSPFLPFLFENLVNYDKSKTVLSE